MWQICKNNKSPEKVKPHRYFTIPKSKQRRTSVIKIILILEYSRLIMIKTVKKRNDDSHDEDGCSNQRGGIETSVTVCVFPLSLMHLPSTVITASTHAEAHSYDGDKDHKHDAEGCTYEKSRLVLDPLREESIHPVISPLSALYFLQRYAVKAVLRGVYLQQQDDVFWLEHQTRCGGVQKSHKHEQKEDMQTRSMWQQRD